MTEFPSWFAMGGVNSNFDKYLSQYKLEEVHFLQIGAYTGDATLWLLENVLLHPKSTITDVDTWEGSAEAAHETLDWSEVEKVYDARVSKYVDAGKVIKKKMTSDEFFATKDPDVLYDFIYVDGNHEAVPVLKDGMNSVEALKAQGILAFDDFQWDSGRGPAFRPRPAIEAIVLCYENRLRIMDIGLQAWLMKYA
jgi:predicted O-methyltransferase YrrM